MYDVLLGLHLLSAAIAFITIVLFTAWALGVRPTKSDFFLADMAWNVSGAGILIFGIWLALNVDGYAVWDGWILGAIVLFGVVGFAGAQARLQALAVVDGNAQAQAMAWHWLRTAALLAILVLMIWKPGA